MSIKSDNWIKRMALECKMIEPFVDEQMRSGVISYGLSSYGYDIRVADEFKVFTNIYNTVVDPKNIDPASMVDFKGPVCVVPPCALDGARGAAPSSGTEGRAAQRTARGPGRAAGRRCPGCPRCG